MQCTLAVQVGASSFNIPWDSLNEWRSVLGCAESLSLRDNGLDLMRVDLNDTRRWIAFQAQVGASRFDVIGYQETVGAIQRDGIVIGGSNRKVLVWRSRPGGHIFIGNKPE